MDGLYFSSFKTYLLCATPRSGSNHLCSILTHYACFGEPREYLFVKFIDEIFLKEWDVPKQHYIVEIISRTQTKNGVVGIKLMGGYLYETLDFIRENTNNYEANDVELMKRYFGDISFIFLTRNNKLEQAISLWKAFKTNQWYEKISDKKNQEASFYENNASLEEIRSHIIDILEQERIWIEFFKKNAIDYLTLGYETYIKDVPKTIQQISDHLSIEVPDSDSIQSIFKKQSNSVNNIVYTKYRQAMFSVASASLIVLLNPALHDHQGTPSRNLGDIIISDAIKQELAELFPQNDLVEIATHTYLDRSHIQLIQQARLVFFGGTNLLTSKVDEWCNWKIHPDLWHYVLPEFDKVVMLGVGWNNYQGHPTFMSQQFIHNTFHPYIIHSVRDEYSRQKLKSIGFNHAINTSCPTLWRLKRSNTNRLNLASTQCIFTLTDYARNETRDTALVEALLCHFKRLIFFPQGSGDRNYLSSLPIVHQNKPRIELLSHSLAAFDALLQDSDCCYIGTRLHSGIRALQNDMDTLILAVDNRATEINKDVGLPVVDASDIEVIGQWIRGETRWTPIVLPTHAISTWKQQFSY